MAVTCPLRGGTNGHVTAVPLQMFSLSIEGEGRGEGKSVKQLWAPWRMQFIAGEKQKGCIFCRLPKQKNDRKNLIVHRGRKAYVILNKFPYNNGHLMVVPNRHTCELACLDRPTLLELMQLTDRSMKLLQKNMGCQGHNVGLNFGLAAGAGILDHLHIHVVPRWTGDTNFMPIFSDSKVMVEYLEATYDRLYSEFKKGVRDQVSGVRSKKK